MVSASCKLILLLPYTSVTTTERNSEAQSWSIPSEDPYRRQPNIVFSQAPRSQHSKCTLRYIYPVYIPDLEHPETYISLLQSLNPSGTPPLLPIPAPSTSRRADIPEADTPPRKRLLLTTPRPECEVGESSAAAAAARQPGPTIETNS
ncbi:hypothetical protein Tco_0065573 [Tanacetum coccineum]